MLRTKTFSIDNLGPYNVVAGSRCQRIEVRENYNSVTPPACDLQQFGADPGSVAVNIPKGTSAIYTKEQNGYFAPGEVAGQINTVSGSCTVAQIESSAV